MQLSAATCFVAKQATERGLRHQAETDLVGDEDDVGTEHGKAVEGFQQFVERLVQLLDAVGAVALVEAQHQVGEPQGEAVDDQQVL